MPFKERERVMCVCETKDPGTTLSGVQMSSSSERWGCHMYRMSHCTLPLPFSICRECCHLGRQVFIVRIVCLFQVIFSLLALISHSLTFKINFTEHFLKSQAVVNFLLLQTWSWQTALYIHLCIFVQLFPEDKFLEVKLLNQRKWMLGRNLV